MFGGLLGLALPIWISIGAYSLPKAPSKLDFPTYNCSSDVDNVTMTTETSLMSTLSTQATTTSEMLVFVSIFSCVG